MVDVGETVIDVPFPADVPPQELVYHCHVAPVPNVPPVIDNVEASPEQISVGFAEAKAAVTDVVFSVTDVFTHVVVLQSPWALT